MVRLKPDCPDSIGTMIVWLDGYATAAHPDGIPGYIALIKRALRNYQRELASGASDHSADEPDRA